MLYSPNTIFHEQYKLLNNHLEANRFKNYGSIKVSKLYLLFDVFLCGWEDEYIPLDTMNVEFMCRDYLFSQFIFYMLASSVYLDRRVPFDVWGLPSKFTLFFISESKFILILCYCLLVGLCFEQLS